MIKEFELIEEGALNLLIKWEPKLFRLEVEEFLIANCLNSI